MTKATQISMPDELHDKLKERAKRQGRSFSSLLSFLIEAKLIEIERTEAVLLQYTNEPK
jgi:predicted DNA-binding protein